MRMISLSLFSVIILSTSIIFGSDYEKFQAGMQKVSPAELITLDGVKHKGRILYVKDSFLLFWEATAPYESDNINEFGIIYPYSEIERIGFKSSKNAFAGSAGGALAGVSTGMVYGERMYERQAGSCLRFPIELYLLRYGCIFGGVGLIVGGIFGSIFDKENFPIKGDYKTYRELLPIISQNTIFPYYLPVEIDNFINQKRQKATLPEPKE